MADVSDVMGTLAALVAQIVYPNGTSQPSVAGVTVAVRRGWPIPKQLDADLANKIANVSVYPRPEEKNTTRYMTRSAQMVASDPTLTLVSSGQTVTVGGAMPSPFTPHNLVVFVDATPYLYAVQSTDTLASIATALASAINVDHSGTVSASAVVTVAAGAVVGATRVATSGTGLRETKRQERLFQITIWAESPAARDAVSAPIDAALSDIIFITLADGMSGRLIYKNSPMMDDIEKANLYRRDLMYTVEYATTVIEPQYEIAAIETNITVADVTETIYQ